MTKLPEHRKQYEQQTFLEMIEKRNEKIREKGGREIDPDRFVSDVEGAIQEMGLEIGRLGTLMDELSELETIGNFSSLHSRTIMMFVELLLKQKELGQENQYQQLERLLAPAIEAARERMALGEGTDGDTE